MYSSQPCSNVKKFYKSGVILQLKILNHEFPPLTISYTAKLLQPSEVQILFRVP
jgi:hypothetical protein